MKARILTVTAVALALATAATIGHTLRSEAAPPLMMYSLGDSITAGSELVDPGHTAYPYVLADRLGIKVLNLAIPGAASGINTEGDVVRSQLDFVHAPCDFATVNIGTNDISLLADGYYKMADYENNVDLILQVLHQTCSRVIVTTVIDNAWNSLALGHDKKNWSRDVRLENAYLSALPDVTLVDLNADPRLHERDSFTPPKLLHPNVSGELAIAEDIEASLRATSAQ